MSIASFNFFTEILTLTFKLFNYVWSNNIKFLLLQPLRKIITIQGSYLNIIFKRPFHYFWFVLLFMKILTYLYKCKKYVLQVHAYVSYTAAIHTYKD